MTYTKKTIDELLEEPVSEEGILVDVQGFVSSVSFATLHDTPEITFALHSADPHSRNIKGSRSYVLIRFHPQENEISLVASALRAQEIIAQEIRIEGTYKRESKNKIVTMDRISLGTGYMAETEYGNGKLQWKWLTQHYFTSENKSSKIVEPK